MAKKTNINELARRYTTAAFELAKSNKELDSVSAQLAALNEGLLNDAQTTKFLNSPLLTAKKQVEFVRSAAKDLGLSGTTLNLLLVVAQNRRLGNLKEIITSFQQRVAEENNEVAAVVTSAAALDAAQIASISADLGKKTGKKVIVKTKLDSSLIGGLIVKIGSVMYDYSIKTKLNRLAAQMQKAS